MKKTLTCGYIGAVYGVLTGCFLAVCLALLELVFTLSHWPADGTVRWAVEGTLSLLLLFLVLGSVFGSISGFLFGVLGAVIKRPLGWLFSGVVSGAAFAGLNIRLLQAATRKSVVPSDTPSYVVESLVCLALFGFMGFVVSRALRTGRPALPKLDVLRSALSGAEQPTNEAV